MIIAGGGACLFAMCLFKLFSERNLRPQNLHRCTAAVFMQYLGSKKPFETRDQELAIFVFERCAKLAQQMVRRHDINSTCDAGRIGMAPEDSPEDRVRQLLLLMGADANAERSYRIYSLLESSINQNRKSALDLLFGVVGSITAVINYLALLQVPKTAPWVALIS